MLTPNRSATSRAGYRNAFIAHNIQPWIPSRRGHKATTPHYADLYRKRHKVENMFVRLKDWRRISTRDGAMRSPVLVRLPIRGGSHFLAMSPDPINAPKESERQNCRGSLLDISNI